MTERDPNQPVGDPPKPTPSADDTPTDTWKTTAWTPPPNGAVEEITATATTAQPVRTSGGGRLRWGVALLITVVIVGIGAIAALLLTGQSAPSSVVGYAPADSIMYGELRLDLPGDQRQKLGQFLSKFPGFKDQASMPTKVDEVLDRIVVALTSNQQDFTTHIKPWFGGELGFSLSNLPVTATPDIKDARFLVLISVTDATKGRAWFDGVLGDTPTSAADHNGTQLVLLGEGTTKGAFGIHGKVMLFGDEASVRAAVDTNGASQLPKAERFAAAIEAVQGDSLGYFWFDMDRYFDWIAAASQTTPGGLGIEFDETYKNLLPEWMVLRLQARGDAIAFEVASPHVDSPVKFTNRAGELAPHLPPSTIALVDAHEIGDALLQTVQIYRTNPGTAEAFKQIDQVAILFGGFEGILGWMRDGGFALTRDGDKIDGGVVFSPEDRAGGERLLATLKSFAVLGGGQAGLQVQARDEPYAGTTISVIDLGDWRDIAALAGGVQLPFEGRLELAYAATDQIVVIGIGDSFVKGVLDAKAGASLADDARYKSLIDRVGAQNVGSVYLDITAVREMFESLFRTADPSGFATYETEIKPYLEPLDAYIQSSAIDGGLDRSVGMVVAK
ncbi:MAG: DUF3352 domain-containing protein [Chloroflexota bacterium]